MRPRSPSPTQTEVQEARGQHWGETQWSPCTMGAHVLHGRVRWDQEALDRWDKGSKEPKEGAV